MFEMLTGQLPFDGNSSKETSNRILKGTLDMPKYLSSEAQSLLRNLLKRNPAKRFCSRGVQELFQHKFFATTDWEKIKHKQQVPPFIPPVVPDETFYFDSCYTSKTPIDSPEVLPSPAAHELFRGFSYVASDLSKTAQDNNE